MRGVNRRGFDEAELDRLTGKLRLAQCSEASAAAEACYQQALDFAVNDCTAALLQQGQHAQCLRQMEKIIK